MKPIGNGSTCTSKPLIARRRSSKSMNKISTQPLFRTSGTSPAKSFLIPPSARILVLRYRNSLAKITTKRVSSIEQRKFLSKISQIAFKGILLITQESFFGTLIKGCKRILPGMPMLGKYFLICLMTTFNQLLKVVP